MNKQDLMKLASDFVTNSKDNYISNEIAMSKSVIGMKIFETPIWGFASSDDDYFTLLKKTEGIGEHFSTPKEWLPQAKSVLSFFYHLQM